MDEGTKVNFRILPLHQLQDYENETSEKHIVVQYRTPGRNYPHITYGKTCQNILTIRCHDVENPPTEFNNQVIRDYPDFYVPPIIHFSEEDAKNIIRFVHETLDIYDIDTIVCQCDAGISRSSATAAALSKIINNDDFWVFENKNYVPNNTIYKMILNAYYESKE